MNSAIIVCIITSSTSVLITVITSIFNYIGNKKSSAEIKRSVDNSIEHTESVVIYRVDKLEEKQNKMDTEIHDIQTRQNAHDSDISVLKEKVKVANHRLDNLEHPY